MSSAAFAKPPDIGDRRRSGSTWRFVLQTTAPSQSTAMSVAGGVPAEPDAVRRKSFEKTYVTDASGVVAIATTADTSDHPLLVSDGQKTFLSWMTKADGYRMLPIGDES